MTATIIPTPALTADGTPRVSTLEIAAKFGKRHDNVMNAVRRKVAHLDSGYCLLHFQETSASIPGPKGGERKLPAYNLTRDAFALVAMSFIGKAAFSWKVRLIEASNSMERQFRTQAHSRRCWCLRCRCLKLSSGTRRASTTRWHIVTQCCSRAWPTASAWRTMNRRATRLMMLRWYWS